MKLLKNIFLNPIAKVLLTIITPIIISILTAMIDWNELQESPNDTYLKFLIGVFAVFFISSISYVAVETKSIRATRKLRKITRIVDDFRTSVESNHPSFKLLQDDIANKRIDLRLWGFTKECDRACECIRCFLEEFSGQRSIIVSIIKRDIKGNYNIVGYSHSADGITPARYADGFSSVRADVKHSFDESFRSPNYIFSKNSQEIKQKYMFDSSDKIYSQYFSIPIYKKPQPSKVIARMEITTYDKVKVFDNKKDAEGYCNYYFSLIINWLENVYQIEEIMNGIHQISIGGGNV